MDARATELNRAATIPADAEIFAFARGATWLYLLGLLLASAETVTLFVQSWVTPDPTTRITQIPHGVFFLLVAELNWRLFRRSRHRVAVNSAGIWSLQGRNVAFLAWHNVAQVAANDLVQKLELTDVTGASPINVEYQLKNFERLREFILSQTARLSQARSSVANTFHRGWGNKIVYAAAGALSFYVAWLIHLQNAAFGLEAPVVAGAVALAMILLEPVSASIGQDDVVIRYLGYQRRVPFKTITRIAISDKRSRGNVWASVVITRARGMRIRLTRFREGSVALYEALQAAWKQAGAVQGFATASPATQPAPPGDLSRAMMSSPARPSTKRRMGFAVALVILLAAALVSSLTRRPSQVSLPERDLAARAWEIHRGPVAGVGELKGSGRIYLVQMGRHSDPYSLDDFARWLHAKYSLQVQVLLAMAIDPSAWDARRRQFVAELLEAELKQKHPDLAADHDAYLIGFTDGDMYSTKLMWSSTFTRRDLLRAAVISSNGMGDSAWQQTHLDRKGAAERFQARMRRILLKDVAILYWHLPVNDDPTSILHGALDPDLPSEDIYESDLDPALSPRGVRVFEPCVYFTYSDKEGAQPLPGPVVRACGDIQDPMNDESVEVFEVVLRLGLFIDKHTDIYLPDTIPIQFQRATRDGGYGKEPFGSSGDDYYDQFLGSADNIHIFLETDDSTQYDMVRVPEWLPIPGLVKYVGGENTYVWLRSTFGGSYQSVWEYRLAWHELPYEHYDLYHFNGETKTFLPCRGVPGLDCMLVDYHDSQGRELKIDRDDLRRLTRVTSPNGSWVGVGTDSDRRIIAIDDSNNRTVLYGYDPDHNLASVTYPLGEVYRYTHDETHHILSVAVSADARSAPRLVLNNEYQNRMLSKLTLADGGVYTFDYDSVDRNAIHHVTISTPDGRIFNVEIGDPWATVHESLIPSFALRR